MRKTALMLGLTAFTLLGSSSIAQAADGGEYVYVESNTSAPNSNAIYAFRRGSSGSLSPLPGSPFLTGGAGVQYDGSNLGPFDSDSGNVLHSLAVKGDGTLEETGTGIVFDLPSGTRPQGVAVADQY